MRCLWFLPVLLCPLAFCADVSGTVQLDPVPSQLRFWASLGGDFAPVHTTEVELREVASKDGKAIALETLQTAPLNSIFSITPPKQKKPRKAGKLKATSPAAGGGSL